MSKHKNSTVSILNPLPGGSGYTSAKRAISFILQGIAEFVGPRAIQFIPRPQREPLILAAELKLARIAAGLNPDDIGAGGMATLDQIGGLPCIMPEKLIRDGSERHTPRAPACGPVRSLVA